MNSMLSIMAASKNLIQKLFLVIKSLPLRVRIWRMNSHPKAISSRFIYG